MDSLIWLLGDSSTYRNFLAFESKTAPIIDLAIATEVSFRGFCNNFWAGTDPVSVPGEKSISTGSS